MTIKQLWTALCALAVGFLGGILVPRSPGAPKTGPLLPGRTDHSTSPARPSSGGIDQTAQRPPSGVDGSEPNLKQPHDVGHTFAQSIYERLEAAGARERDIDPDAIFEALGQLDQLNPSMAAFFIAKYKSKLPETDMQALQLAIACGGPDVSDLLQSRLQDPSATMAERANICTILDTTSGNWTPLSRIPLTSGLTDCAFAMLESSNARERIAALSLLGRATTPGLPDVLLKSAETDAHIRVKAAALRALAYAGSRDSIPQIESFHERFWRSDTGRSLMGDDIATVRGSVRFALRKLKERFPQ